MVRKPATYPRGSREAIRVELADVKKQLEALNESNQTLIRERDEYRSKSNILQHELNHAAGALFPDTQQINVVDCCGVFGYLIPWASWKARPLPIVPTRDFSRPHIFLYSVAGQLGTGGKPLNTFEQPKLQVYAINLDLLLNWDSKLPDWDKLADEITKRWPRPQGQCSTAFVTNRSGQSGTLAWAELPGDRRRRPARTDFPAGTGGYDRYCRALGEWELRREGAIVQEALQQ